MYAIIRAGGKQYKVAKGDVIEIERTKEDSEKIEFVPLLVVDDKGKTRSGKSELADARVTATVVGESQGPKVNVAKYRNKTGYRRNTGHRQRYTSVQISGIKMRAARSRSKTPETQEETSDGA
ncbi:MAG: 50S ribosomal protein L21 [Actinomycetota bacterium]|nr:50S ribosomal protein L21 [Actinomycetota bacterium]